MTVARSHRVLTRVCMVFAVIGNIILRHRCSSSWFGAFAPPTSTFEYAPALLMISASNGHVSGPLGGGPAGGVFWPPAAAWPAGAAVPGAGAGGCAAAAPAG